LAVFGSLTAAEIVAYSTLLGLQLPTAKVVANEAVLMNTAAIKKMTRGSLDISNVLLSPLVLKWRWP
jgi:hypothetical protein